MINKIANPPTGIMNQLDHFETLEDFCENEASLNSICSEFNCKRNTIVYTKEQAEEKLSLNDLNFRDLKESMNREIEIDE